MEKINFKLEVFEGPLDLLLFLISKHKLNIVDIEITQLLEQYLAYIEEMKEADLEVASEFLEMAAVWCISRRCRCFPAMKKQKN